MAKKLQAPKRPKYRSLPPGTYDIAHAAGMDAGNASMRRAGREAWNEEDRDACVAQFDKIYNEEDDRMWKEWLAARQEWFARTGVWLT